MQESAFFFFFFRKVKEIKWSAMNITSKILNFFCNFKSKTKLFEKYY